MIEACIDTNAKTFLQAAIACEIEFVAYQFLVAALFTISIWICAGILAYLIKDHWDYMAGAINEGHTANETEIQPPINTRERIN